jgi:hypothetical protein
MLAVRNGSTSRSRTANTLLVPVYNLIFQSNKMPDEWMRSILVPIFKNNGMCKVVHYQGIKLMSHTIKLWERIIEHRLREVSNVTKN